MVKNIDDKPKQNNGRFTIDGIHSTDNKTGVAIRKVAGHVWVDNSLSDWPEDDHRIFVGNLGNDVNDKILEAAFSHLPSYQRCRVVRNKANGKTRGYGFVSFSDPYDLLRCLKEINGAYIGSRPCTILRSKWRDRAVDSERNQKIDKMLQDVDKSAAVQAQRTVRKFTIKRSTEPEAPKVEDKSSEEARINAQIRQLERLEAKDIKGPAEPKQRRVFGHVAAFGANFDRGMKNFLQARGLNVTKKQ